MMRNRRKFTSTSPPPPITRGGPLRGPKSLYFYCPLRWGVEPPSGGDFFHLLASVSTASAPPAGIPMNEHIAGVDA